MPRARFSAVDAHNHLGRWLSPDGDWTTPELGALLELMDASNVRAIVNLDGMWGDELEANLDRYDRAHPGRFSTFCQLDWGQTVRPGFGQRLAASVERSAAAGAKGLKIWKDLGTRVRDDRGALVLRDDPRLVPIWAAAADRGLSVAIHTADPVAFFDPVDERNERLEELLAHPDWSFADGERFPRFGRLIESLETLVGANPLTTFVGVHVGGYAEDLAWVTRMLDTNPNFYVDVAARLAELGRQPRTARRLIETHADQVLFGTDAFPPDAGTYAIHFRFLETGDEHFAYSGDDPPPQGRWAVSGLELPDDVLRKVYAENALRLIPSLDG